MTNFAAVPFGKILASIDFRRILNGAFFGCFNNKFSGINPGKFRIGVGPAGVEVEGCKFGDTFSDEPELAITADRLGVKLPDEFGAIKSKLAGVDDKFVEESRLSIRSDRLGVEFPDESKFAGINDKFADESRLANRADRLGVEFPDAFDATKFEFTEIGDEFMDEPRLAITADWLGVEVATVVTDIAGDGGCMKAVIDLRRS